MPFVQLVADGAFMCCYDML